MIDRIRELMENEQFSPSQFADEIKLQRSSLSHVLSGRNKPSLDFVIKIKQRFPKVNFEWLIFGTGKMYENINNELTGNINIPKEEHATDENQQLLNFDRVTTNDSIDEKPLEKTIEPEKDNSKFEIKTTSDKADRVIIFYKNGTFREYIKD